MVALAAAVGAAALVVAGSVRVAGDGCGQPFDRDRWIADDEGRMADASLAR